jgi:hypothetical protein
MTTTYRAEFFTAADYAVRNFEAETAEDALRLARQFYDDDIGELDFRSYDDNAGLDQIQIWDPERGPLASWESDDYRLRKAAPDLLRALKLVLEVAFIEKETKQQGLAAIAKAETRGSSCL